MNKLLGVRLAFLALLLVVLVRTAWLCDDAYISLRTVENFQDGHGLRWNVAERVQTSTHPLWLFVLAGATRVTGEMFRTTLSVSIVLSMLAVALVLFRQARSIWGVLGAGLVVVLSPAFVDYATSGLEVALSYTLFAAFACVYFTPGATTRRLFWLSLLAALALTNRLDHVWIYAPAVGYELWRAASSARVASLPRRGVVAAGVTGMLPLVAWLAFALIYYGFVFPNAAAAKVWTGLPLSATVMQGARFVLDAVVRETLTVGVIVVAVTLAWRQGGAPRALAAGVLLDLVYIVVIGGDFMRGRFLALPLLVSLCLLAQVSWPAQWTRPVWRFAVFGLAVAAGLLAPSPPLLSGRAHGQNASTADFKRHAGIADERWMYFAHYGLLNETATPDKPGADLQLLREQRVSDPTRLKIVWTAGRSGFAQGSTPHLVEPNALTDAFLARLAIPPDVPWRIGHFMRPLPAGYLSSLAFDRNDLVDPELHVLYEKLRSVTRGPLFSRQRWADIWSLNLRTFMRPFRGADYGDVPSEEYVEVYEHLGPGAGPTIRWEAAQSYIVRRDLDAAKVALRSLFDTAEWSRYGYVAPDYTLEAVRYALEHDTRGQREFAEELLGFLGGLEPERYEPHAALGALNLNAGRLDAARRHFEAAAERGDAQSQSVLEQLPDESGE